MVWCKVSCGQDQVLEAHKVLGAGSRDDDQFGGVVVRRCCRSFPVVAVALADLFLARECCWMVDVVVVDVVVIVDVVVGRDEAVGIGPTGCSAISDPSCILGIMW